MTALVIIVALVVVLAISGAVCSLWLRRFPDDPL